MPLETTTRRDLRWRPTYPLQQRLATRCVSVSWYDDTTRTVEITSQTAVWYRSGKPPVTIRWVLIRDPQNTFDPQALLCTDSSADPTQILEWFVLRWQLEVTFQEVRTHLGVETQRQWSDLAIPRTTPVLLGLFSWTTLGRPCLAETSSHHPAHCCLVRQTLAHVCGCHRPGASAPVARVGGFALSAACTNTQELPASLYHRMVDSLAYAA